ncbi:MAG: hypothetical protein ACKO7P_15475 [Bacteroidota bacterium]
MKSKTSEPILFEIAENKDLADNPKVLRVILDSEFTRIDFGYNATGQYIKGGWIRMSPKTYVEVQGLAEKFLLTETTGITIAPKKVVFQSVKDWQFFTLYFQPIPQKDCVINIIEEEKPTPNDFNYYGIELKIDEGVGILQNY